MISAVNFCGERLVGVGTDLVRIDRIEQAVLRSGERFVRRILRPEEVEIYNASSHPVRYLAKRFAAKEAASKALGCGIGKVSWQDFLVNSDELGAPRLDCYDSAWERLQECGAKRALISLSDEQEHALAFVVLSAK